VSDPSPTVFVVDDDPSFRSGITRLLRASGYRAEGFSSAREFLARRSDQAPGCVLADLQMPEMDGLALQRALAGSGNPMPVVFLTGHGDIPTSVAAMRDGAEDFLVKTAPKKELLAAVERALARDAVERTARDRRRELLQRFARLTPRENEVLTLVLRGQLNKQIAADLHINERSVKRHRASLMRRLGADSLAELAKLAFEAGKPGTSSD